MSWSEMWAFFQRVPVQIQHEIWKQIDLDNWLLQASMKVQEEVLKYAPRFVQVRYNVSPEPQVKIKSPTKAQIERKLRSYLR